MSLDNTLGDEKRTRIGLLFLVAGTLLVVWAWGSWVFRTADTPKVSGEAFDSGTSGDAADGGSAMVAVGFAALSGIVLVGYLLVRRFRRHSARRDKPFGSPDGSNDQSLAENPRRDSG